MNITHAHNRIPASSLVAKLTHERAPELKDEERIEEFFDTLISSGTSLEYAPPSSTLGIPDYTTAETGQEVVNVLRSSGRVTVAENKRVGFRYNQDTSQLEYTDPEIGRREYRPIDLTA